MTDIQLWTKILKGDNRAWADLVHRYQSLVYSIPCRAGLSMVDIADCFQYTWVTLYKNRKKIKDPSRLSAWLVTTAKREAIRLRTVASKDKSESLDPNTAIDKLLQDEYLELLESQAELENAILELDPRCRDLVDLFFFSPEDFSYKQISEALGIQMNSLGPIRKRCLERLKKILLKNGFEGIRKEESGPL